MRFREVTYLQYLLTSHSLALLRYLPIVMVSTSELVVGTCIADMVFRGDCRYSIKLAS